MVSLPDPGGEQGDQDEEHRRNAEERKAKADAEAKAGKGEPKGGPEPALKGPKRLYVKT